MSIDAARLVGRYPLRAYRLAGPRLAGQLGIALRCGAARRKRALGVRAGRADRALRNFAETYPAFIDSRLWSPRIAVIFQRPDRRWGAAALFILFEAALSSALISLGVALLRSLIFIGMTCFAGWLLMF